MHKVLPYIGLGLGIFCFISTILYAFFGIELWTPIEYHYNVSGREPILVFFHVFGLITGVISALFVFNL